MTRPRRATPADMARVAKIATTAPQTDADTPCRPGHRGTCRRPGCEIHDPQPAEPAAEPA